jgi:hypothetical protein
MDYDSASNMKAVPAITPGTYTSDQISAALDTSLYSYKALTIAVYLGVGGITFDSTNKLEVNVTHSDDDSTYVSVTDDDVVIPYSTTATVALLGATDGTVKALVALHAAAEVFLCGYRGKKRYVKVQLDFDGTHSPGTLAGAEWLFEHPMSAPSWQTSVPDTV